MCVCSGADVLDCSCLDSRLVRRRHDSPTAETTYFILHLYSYPPGVIDYSLDWKNPQPACKTSADYAKFVDGYMTKLRELMQTNYDIAGVSIFAYGGFYNACNSEKVGGLPTGPWKTYHDDYNGGNGPKSTEWYTHLPQFLAQSPSYLSNKSPEGFL